MDGIDSSINQVNNVAARGVNKMDFIHLLGSGALFADTLSVVRGIFGFVLVFFIPGFAWTLVLFHRLNVLERVVLSFGLSIAVVTLSIFALNTLLHVSITTLHSLLIILAITVVALGIYAFQRFRHRQ